MMASNPVAAKDGAMT